MDELDRYINDPEYRRKKVQEKNNGKNGNPSFSLKKGHSDKKDSSFSLKKEKEESASKKSSIVNVQEKKPSLTSAKKEDSEQKSDRDSASPTNAPDIYKAKRDSSEDYEVYIQPHEAPSKKLTWLGAFGIWMLMMVGGACLAILFYFSLLDGLPSIEELENPKTDIASFVKSRDGVVIDKYFTENRTWVPFEQISPHVINALVSIEDHRFFDHWGIDVIRLAGLPYYWIQGRVHGGSTITQQLARNLYKKIGREVSISRKLSEMITAIQIERNYTKREILAMYLNTVEFSNSSFGIEAAAQTHFGKPAKDLNVVEAATLVGTLQAVFYFNPRLRPENALRKRNLVLFKMMEHGFMSELEYNELKQKPIELDYNPPFKAGRKSRYFGEFVRQEVSEWTEENGYDLYRDGLVIHTTIDSRYQKHAEEAVRAKLDSLQPIFQQEWTSSEGRQDSLYMDKLWKKYPLFLDSFIEETVDYRELYDSLKTILPAEQIHRATIDSLKKDSVFVDRVKRERTRLEAGFVAIDPTNGNILAWVGGSDYSKFQFDHVNLAKRQAGSTFKPFVYTVAIDNGYMPYHKFSKYPTKFYNRAGQVWAPSDESIASGDEFVPLRKALARSMNNVTVRLLPELSGHPGSNRLEHLEVAAKKIVDMAQKLGIKSDMSPYPSIALGTADVTLLEMVSAYTTFANKGVHIEPLAITRIEDKEGNVLVEYRPDYQREVISPETAYIMIDMLRGVIRGVDGLGTGIRLRNVYGIRQDIAGKTGTTQNSADNWFIAMTPAVVMGAWVGGEDRRIRFPEDTYIGQGARTALPIVGQFINQVKGDPLVEWSTDGFEQPAGFVMPEPPKEEASTNSKDNRLGRIGW